MKIKDIKKVHCIGIGGSGVSALAKYFYTLGANVSGSNLIDQNLADLRLLGIRVFVGHKKEYLDEDVKLVIYSSAISDDNQEILKAKNLGIKTLSYTQALGEIMKDSFGVSVSGTNGKTTTTALLGLMLDKCGIEPTVILGGNVSKWNGNFKSGIGEIFLVEGCEYKKNILNLWPKMIVLTNIEEDHLDCYTEGIEEIKSTFGLYISKLDEKEVLVFNADDENILDVVKDANVVKISYGIKDECDLRAMNIINIGGTQEFDVKWHGKFIGKFRTNLPGKFNVYNILAACAGALYLGVSVDDIMEVVRDFRGTGRRFEIFNLRNGKVIISDYAHHPTSVRETIRATKEFYTGNDKKILVVFQPHQKDRTIKLFDGFVESFDKSDNIILSEIYEVSGRNNADREISSQDLASAIKKKNKNANVYFAKNIKETESLIKEKMDLPAGSLSNFDVVLIMGAGDIFHVVDSLVNTYKTIV